MGIKINVNTILRYEPEGHLAVGREYPFEKASLVLLADNIKIWLAAPDWTALGEIQVTRQERQGGRTSGIFRVEYVYPPDEQEPLTAIFRRMYGWD